MSWRERTISEIREHLELPSDFDIQINPMTDDIIISKSLAFAITRNEVEDNLHLVFASERYKELKERMNG